MGQRKIPITARAAAFRMTAAKTRLLEVFFGAAAGGLAAAAGAGTDFGWMGLGFGALEGAANGAAGGTAATSGVVWAPGAMAGACCGM